MVPRKAGTDWEILAPAKLNLYLKVLGKRSDGFHDLDTLMVPVQLCDQLRWCPENSGRPVQAESCSLTVDSRALNPGPSLHSLNSSENLVLQAAHLVAARIGRPPHGHFQLTKRIPLQAGLGGGSSDAAATLRLTNACWKAGLAESELAQLAAELGSDVPFFLHSGPAICRGRGERISTAAGLANLHFVLVKPSFGLSTAQVFQEFSSSKEQIQSSNDNSTARLTSLIGALQAGALSTASRWMTNCLESAAARIAPEILCIKNLLADAGCRGQLMTGSGSTLFGIARSARHARWIARQLSAQSMGTVLVTSTSW
ncbi:4-(cytidine 5'-diphospho)-2-C-methyl-D-erythritol kinase [Bythopirellula goksoeyrii]|uniref:4-diphosphocytidyl-2-C-methyl-D-erythritol kinase n=1 Tax=Bythopirellula goksoeyrii TaxID=1400387 RepID=A0A5B9Q4S6_9BACT|nr:4-(cytidine 5'-diphospho)-2-C-methyl-D-erythritol kinase [Bythopirellula goksoeyrii]QEG34038.1 4-diphosphocytidyl-2-C-methyl-D-erythritol kinase [Bythopirellula goksoeyrii]